MAAGPAFLFHIGPHKTGSSYLQSRFQAMRPALAARGILFPVFWAEERASGHAQFAARLRAGDTDALQAAFASMLASGADTVLISAEYMSALEMADLVTLRRLLAGRAARFVFYVRRWSELLPSTWQERVKQGNAATLPEFLLTCLRNPAEFPPLNFGLSLQNYTKIFGAACLHIVCYSELRDLGLDLFSHFAANFLDWPDAPGEAGAVNPSRDVAAIEIIRVLNSFSRHRGGAPKDRLRMAFDRLDDRAFLQPVTTAIEAYTRTIRIADRWPGLETLHAALAATYHDRIVPPRRPHALFKGRVNDVPYADTAYLAEPGIADILRGLHARLETEA